MLELSRLPLFNYTRNWRKIICEHKFLKNGTICVCFIYQTNDYGVHIYTYNFGSVYTSLYSWAKIDDK